MDPITEPGIYDLCIDAYHGDPCEEPSISASGLRLMLDCPARFWAQSPRNPKRVVVPPTPAMTLGQAAHVLFIEDETEFHQRFHILSFDDLRTKAAKAEKADAEESGKTVIKPGDWDTVRGMRDALAAHPWAGAAFQRGKVERSLIWKDQASGTWQRVRPDFLPDKKQHIPDYKTAASCKKDDFRKAVWNFGYHVQAAHYLDGIQQVTGATPEHFFFVVQEKAPPYLVNVVVLGDTALEWGRIEARAARLLFAKCLKEDSWPGYSDHPETVELPAFAEAQLEQAHGEGRFTDIEVVA